MKRSRVLYEGLIAGLLGFAVVALAVGVLDVVAGRSFFHTPSLLGQVVIGGFGEPTPGVIEPGPVFAYNGLHMLVFLAVGMAVSWVVFEVELHPVLWYVAFFALMSLVLLSFLLLAVVARPHREELSAGVLVTANALGALAIGLYLHAAHPRLRTEVEEHGDPEVESEP